MVGLSYVVLAYNPELMGKQNTLYYLFTYCVLSDTSWMVDMVFHAVSEKYPTLQWNQEPALQ